MGQVFNWDVAKVHAAAFPVMRPGFIVSYDAALHIATAGTRSGLLTVALASSVTKVRISPTVRTAASMLTNCRFRRSGYTAPNIQRARLAGYLRILSTFGMGVAIAPTNVIGRLSIGAARGWSIIAVACCFRAASAY
jgi:hypothetical protein